MQALWYGMFVRILYRVVTSAAAEEEKLHDVGRVVYEGASDDEGGDAPTPPVGAKKGPS